MSIVVLSEIEHSSPKRRRLAPVCCSIVFWILPAISASAQIQLDRFFPPVVAAGEASLITAEGKFPTWPVNGASSNDGVALVSEPDSGKLKITVSPDTLPGLSWIRLFDDRSASQLVPLIISPVSVLTETEPNNKRSEANPVTLPAVIAGRLSKSGDSDAYKVSLKNGQRLVVNLTANQVLRSPMDAVLQLTDRRGNVLLQSDDQRGLDPQLVYQSDSDQDLLVRVFAFPETPNSTVGFGGSSAFVYVLDATTGPYLDHVADTSSGVRPFGEGLEENPKVRVAPSDNGFPSTASVDGALGWAMILPYRSPVQPMIYGSPHDGSLPVVIAGHIQNRREAHTVSVAVEKGAKYRAEVRSKTDGFLLDSMLEIVDPVSGSVLASNDDLSRGGYDAGVDFSAKADGKLNVRLTEKLEAFGPRHFYHLTVKPQPPGFRISLATDRFVLESGKPLEIPVTLTRLSGFNGTIRITAADLPPGVSAEPVISEPKGDTAKSVKLELKVEKPFVGNASIRVVGSALGEGDVATGAEQAATYALRPSFSISHFWLTVTGQTQDKEK